MASTPGGYADDDRGTAHYYDGLCFPGLPRGTPAEKLVFVSLFPLLGAYQLDVYFYLHLIFSFNLAVLERRCGASYLFVVCLLVYSGSGHIVWRGAAGPQ